MNRRNFFSKSAAVLVASSAMSRNMLASATTLATSSTSEAAKLNKGRIGFQLYGIREEMEKDFVGSMKKLSDIGYSAVETFGNFDDKFYGYSMKELDAIVKGMGMSISGGMYQGWQKLPEDINSSSWDNWKFCISELNSVGCKWAVQASMPGGELKTMDDLKYVATHFNRVGELCKKSGLKFAFHNHAADFKVIEGSVVFDYLLKNTDPKLVYYQMDCGNIIYVGRDCLQYLRDYPGRFPLWHTTDCNAATQERKLAGDGDVPFVEMFNIAKSYGLEQLTNELHTGQNNFDSCKKSFDYLKQFKWTKA